jgi:hypothetical protein
MRIFGDLGAALRVYTSALHGGEWLVQPLYPWEDPLVPL